MTVPANLSKALLAVLLLCLGFATACSSAPETKDALWPQVTALPEAPPSDLQRSAPATMLRSGSDGFYYVVGGLPEDVKIGSSFLGRYGGDWPFNDVPRPPLVAGQVVEIFDDVALASITYESPEAELEEIELTWEGDPDEEDLGKGLGRVSAVASSGESVTLSVETSYGVKVGDIYGLMSVPKNPSSLDIQMARRLQQICLVDNVLDGSANCRIWRGSSLLPKRKPAAVGDTAVFLEHTYARAPQEALIHVARIEGHPKAQKALEDSLRAFVASMPSAKTRVEVLDQSFDATRLDFHRIESEVEYAGRAHIVVAGTVVDRDGTPHLVVNYSGIGPAVGPGMVAAPPEGGVDVGPVDRLEPQDLVPLAAVVWAGVGVYRGQTSETLMHLALTLSDEDLRGPLRWHARDQFAMRFAGLGFVQESLWLVEQDLAVASRNSNERAYLNALGTLVRLFDMLELPEVALELSTEYLAARRDEKPNAAYLSAAGMHVEMLFAADEDDAAMLLLQELMDLCPDGCSGDLPSLLMAAYWGAPEGEDGYQERVLTALVKAASEDGGGALASARVYQGLESMKDERYEDAMIAFLEAERLYKNEKYLSGVARAKYFLMLTQMARENPEDAYEAGRVAVEIQMELRDFSDAAHTFSRMAALYVNFDQHSKPGPYLGAARDVLAASVDYQLAMGNLSKASESLFNAATFLLKIGRLADAKAQYQGAVAYAIRSTRFDIAAMSHLSLGIIAREEEDADAFRDEISRARVMAEISGDPKVIEAIKRALTGPSESEEPPTKLL